MWSSSPASAFNCSWSQDGHRSDVVDLASMDAESIEGPPNSRLERTGYAGRSAWAFCEQVEQPDATR